MTRKVYEVDPLVCPQCGATMRVIAFLSEFSVVDRIIPPQADLCRSDASAASDRFAGSPDGRRDRCRIFYMIFSYPGRRGLGDFRSF
jgi:hypothetical protein